MASLSRRLSRSFILTAKPSQHSTSFCTNIASNDVPNLEDSSPGFDRNSSSSSSPSSSSSSTDSNQRRPAQQRPLENGIDIGVYKAILVGQAGQSPVQKRLSSGRLITMFSLGTGGIRNNRRPFEDEDPRQYADRCAVQWHRVAVHPERLGQLVFKHVKPGVAVHPERLGRLVFKHVKPGSILYLEGNLETKIFSDPLTGIVRRIREIAIRQDGRFLFLSKDGDATQPTQKELRSVGYY